MRAATERPLLLIVDDEPMNLILLERVFASDFQVKTAAGGQAALDLLAQEPFDCILLDIMMPGVSGLQVLESVRSTKATADLPVILVTALGDRQDVVRGLKLGANDYVSKPIELDILSARVQTQITLKQLQDQRKLAYEELQHAHEMKDRLLRIASHDLKSPLANVGMIRYLLRDAVADNPTAVGLVDMLDSAADHMLAVIRDFLDTAALQSGELDIQFEDLAAVDIIQEVCEQYHLPALHKHIALELAEADGLVRADRMRTAQMLDNLVSNAIKYSPPDSTVFIWTEQRDGFVRLCVADQGPGIPEAEQTRLFTQFGKLSNRPTGGESSTGLGLWIVKHLVTLQGGDVGYEPAPDGGSIFWIELPEAQTEPLTYAQAGG